VIELYHSPISTCSQKVRLALAEKGLEYESRVVDLSRLGHLEPEYLKINPNGVVPSIVHDGQPIIDSSVICEYLDEVYAQPPLSPRDAVGRAKMRAWLRFLEEVPTAAIRVPSFNAFFARAFWAQGREAFEALRARLPLRKQFYSKMRATGFDDEDVENSRERLQSALERAEKALKKGEWLLGEQFTLADIVYIPTVVRMDDLGLSHMWKDMSGLTAWYARVKVRPSFAVAYFPGSRIDRSTFDFNLNTGTATGALPSDK
jgi:glutathione S-transferase